MFPRLIAMAKKHAAPASVLAFAAALYAMAGIPTATEKELTSISSSFRFQSVEFAPVAGGTSPARTVREVNPSLKSIASWISSVGAGIALADLDGDAVDNEVCLVDPRTDQVVIAPAVGRRFSSFNLPWKMGVDDKRPIAPMGCLPGDPNEDGRTDLLVYFWGQPPLLFLNETERPGGLPVLVPHPFAPDDGPWYSNAATFADIDGDGHTDLIIGNYFPEDAAVLDPNATTPTEMQDSMSRAENGGRNRLYLWTGDPDSGFFQDASDALPSSGQRAWTLAIAAGDIDGDLKPELYFANDFGQDRLLHNRSTPGKPKFSIVEGRRTFTMPRSKVLGQDSFKGMGAEFGDINADGLPDIFVSNIAKEYALEESHFAFINTGRTDLLEGGIAPFVDESETLGLSRSSWGWDTKLADLNNDGRPEILQATGFVDGKINRWPELHEIAMGNDQMVRHVGAWPRVAGADGLSSYEPEKLFAWGPDGRYHDIAPLVGFDTAVAARGIATADIDADGDLDFAVANQWAPSFLYINQLPSPGMSLRLDIRYPTSSGTPGRTAVGAHARVVLPDHRHLVGQVDGGNGHSGKRSSVLHFGLGNHPANIPVPVVISWRDRTGVHAEEFSLLPGYHRIVLPETDALIADIGRRPNS